MSPQLALRKSAAPTVPENKVVSKTFVPRPGSPGLGNGIDATELLLSNPIDRKRLLAAVAAEKVGISPALTFTEEEFEAFNKDLLAK